MSKYGSSLGATKLVPQGRSKTMLGLVIAFLLLALIAGILGFTGLVVAFAEIAKILFFIFLVLFLISLVTHRRPVV
jgi:uncharacterized membrane protein YtjA (UPF0391 family)